MNWIPFGGGSVVRSECSNSAHLVNQKIPLFWGFAVLQYINYDASYQAKATKNIIEATFVINDGFFSKFKMKGLNSNDLHKSSHTREKLLCSNFEAFDRSKDEFHFPTEYVMIRMKCKSIAKLLKGFSTFRLLGLLMPSELCIQIGSRQWIKSAL